MGLVNMLFSNFLVGVFYLCIQFRHFGVGLSLPASRGGRDALGVQAAGAA